jgi:predicted amino acid-binding ACT domain protein
MDRPYRGLQPYTETDEDLFFGRDAEKAILIDKILADKLTLLFAASGVGKSSLLQAAVMPELKRPHRENLDVVYYNDWVTPPLQGLTKTILETLQERGKIDSSVFSSKNVGNVGQVKRSGPDDSGAVGSAALEPTYSYSRVGALSLADLLTMCATFASEPFVITTKGPDRKGLVAAITAIMAAHRVNVTNLQAVFKGGDDPNANIMIYEVDIPNDADQQALRQELMEKARTLSLDISIQHKLIFEAINRI